jgi:GNAT superfamily N-acetyltransferase
MNNFQTFENAGYSISDDATKLNIQVVHQYLSTESYWAKHIPFETVERAIQNSLCFGVYHQQEQIGFARLITDKATFAYLADVFILPAHRGKGLSKWLMQVIHTHPATQGLRRMVLATRDAHTLYEQFGWTRFAPEQLERFMQLHNPSPYPPTK